MLRSYLFYRCPTCRAPWTNAVLAAAERQASQQLLNGVCPLVVVQEERDDRTNNAQAGKSTEKTDACGAAGRTVVGVLVSGRRSGITRVTGLTGVAGIDRGRRRCGLERRADIPFVVLQSEAIEGAVAAEVVGEFLRYASVEVTGDHAGLAAVVFCCGRGRGDDTGQGYGCDTEDR